MIDAHQIADTILWVSLAGFMVSWGMIYWCLQKAKAEAKP